MTELSLAFYSALVLVGGYWFMWEILTAILLLVGDRCPITSPLTRLFRALRLVFEVSPDWVKAACVIDICLMLISTGSVLHAGPGVGNVGYGVIGALGLTIAIVGAKRQKQQRAVPAPICGCGCGRPTGGWHAPADYFLPIAVCPKCGLEDSHLMQAAAAPGFDVVRTCTAPRCRHTWGQRVGSYAELAIPQSARLSA